MEKETIWSIDEFKTQPAIPFKMVSGHVLEFGIGQTVYLKTDREQRPRIITGIHLRPFNSVAYMLSFETTETYHFAFEVNSERDIILATS